MTKGTLKSFFPGGNTSRGFYSFYHHMIEPDATRIFVIKGGPGVGKSTLMRKIGENMLDRGYDVEYHCCSSDNGSLDGVHIPEIRVALLDGTAPHVVDPKNPGAVDEIIHLGDFWNEEKLRAAKEEILSSNARVGRLFQIAYASLKEAGCIMEEWESYISEAQDWARVNQITYDIQSDLEYHCTPQFQKAPKSRHLFASAITPLGPVTHFPAILQGITKLYSIQGLPGSGKSSLIAKAAQWAQDRGLDTEVYHRPLTPEEVDGVVIPALQTAVVNTGLPFTFNPHDIQGLSDIVPFDLSKFLRQDIIQTYILEIEAAANRFRAAFNRGSEYVGKAKGEHDRMETFYIPAMDFAAINRKREEILERILKYAGDRF
jgi:GTPase SAR1 family protein